MYFCEGISSSDIRKVMLEKLYFSKWRKDFLRFFERKIFCIFLIAFQIVILKKLYFSKRKTIFLCFGEDNFRKKKQIPEEKLVSPKNKKKKKKIFISKQKLFCPKKGGKKLFQKKKYFLQRINILFSPNKKKKAGENINKIFIFF